MTHGMVFAGDYRSAALQKLIPGKWYVGFACKECGQNFAIMNEPTDTGSLEISGDASFDVTCPNCYEQRRYSADEIVQFSAAQGGPVSTA